MMIDSKSIIIEMELGRGAYGSVVKEGNKAVKSFKKMSHLVQEWIAGYYLRDCPYTVSPSSFDLNKLTLTMDLFDTSLRKFIESGEMTETDKKLIIRDILLGLNYIHQLGLVHGDLKPGNILVKRYPFKVVLGDLGFVSLRPFAKVERTAATYRDKEPRHSPDHDMYSLGIIMLELHGDIRVHRQVDYKEIKTMVKEFISDAKMGKLIRRLTHKKARPSAFEVLTELYDSSPLIDLPILKGKDVLLGQKTLVPWMKEVAQRHAIQRAKRGYKAVTRYLFSNSIKEEKWQLHAAAAIIILSSVFGLSGFTSKVARVSCKKKYSEEEINLAVACLMADNEFVVQLMLP